MKRLRNILGLVILTICLFIGLSDVFADSTVLYEDGTLIIQEKDEDRETNIEKHGNITSTFDFDENVIYNYDNIPWEMKSNYIKYVEIGQVIQPKSTAYWFSNCDSMTGGDFNNLDTSNVTDMENMFSYAGYKSTTFSIDLSKWDTSNVTNMKGMFRYAGYKSTTFSMDFSKWDTSNVTDMENMFDAAGYKSTTFSIDLSKWDTSKVVNMNHMFYTAGRQASIWSIGDISNWDTSKVTNMYLMFSSAGYNATTWSIGNLSNWDTSNVTDMENMFAAAGRQALIWSIGDISKWDTSKVTNMYGMFSSAGYNATTWSIGNLSNWDTSSVTDMFGMFMDSGYNAATWSIGDVSSWNTAKVTDMYGMFINAGYNAINWTYIDISNWNLSSLVNASDINNMFKNSKVNLRNIGSYNIVGIEDKEYTGSSITFDIKLYDNDIELDSRNYEIRYADNIQIGKATITIVGKNKCAGTITKTFNILPIDISNAEVDDLEDKEYTGNEIEQSLTLLYKGEIVSSDNYDITYSNNIEIGEATITITGKGNYTGTKIVKFNILPTDISNVDIEGLKDKEYNGKELVQNLVLYNDGSIVPSDEYDITYSNNIEVGEATITIAGKNNYTGTKIVKFNILPADIYNASISNVVKKIYNGKAQTQNLVVTLGGKTLVLGTDYDVIYKDNINVGWKTITLKGKGNYTGTTSVVFGIYKAKNTAKVTVANKTVKYSATKKKKQVVSKAIAVKKNQGKVTFERVKKGSHKNLTIDKKTGKITVKKGTKKGTYKIKVKVNVKGNANYKYGWKNVTVKIKVK